MLCVARALWLTSLIIHLSLSKSPICCPTAAMSTAVALAVENARRRHEQQKQNEIDALQAEFEAWVRRMSDGDDAMADKHAV